ncbi:hypothetical protein Tco_0195095 [Tanacetum coccineum]
MSALKTICRKRQRAEYDESNTYVLERFNTTASNPVKKILLKLNLSDHRLILTDSKEYLKMVMEGTFNIDVQAVFCYRTWDAIKPMLILVSSHPNSRPVKGEYQPEDGTGSVEVGFDTRIQGGWILRIEVSGEGTTFDIFQNIHILNILIMAYSLLCIRHIKLFLVRVQARIVYFLERIRRTVSE